MNIALFASAFYPHVGGVEELVRQMAHDYRRRGMDAIVISNRWPRSLPAYEDYEGIPTYRLALRMPDQSAKSKVSYALTHRSIQKEVLEILKKHAIDLLHVQCISVNGYYAMLSQDALKLPLVVTTQGERTMFKGRLFLDSALMESTLRTLLERADYVTACSRDTLQDLEDFRGKPFGDRARTVYNGVDLEEFEGVAPFEHPRPFILGLGRLIPKKGYDILLRAYAKAIAPNDQANAEDSLSGHDLLIAGEGAERESLEALSRELGLENRVRFMGRAERPLAVALFKGCSFFVLPSRLEPFGIVNLEAMAAEKAVVAARVGGVPEFVSDGESGVLFQSEDVDALAAALTRMCADQSLRDRMGKEGRRRAEGFSWPAIAAQYIDIYDHVLKTRQAVT